MRRFSIFLLTFFLSSSLFAIERNSKTLDNFSFRLYSIYKSLYPDSFEFYVELKSEDTEEYFVWCSDELSKAMVNFRELENTEVVTEEKDSETLDALSHMYMFGGMTLDEAKEKYKMIDDVKIDLRDKWRKSAYVADEYNEFIRYWIKIY